MILSKIEQIRKDLRENPLKTQKDRLKFKRQVINCVDDYLKYILKDYEDLHTELRKKLKNK